MAWVQCDRQLRSSEHRPASTLHCCRHWCPLTGHAAVPGVAGRFCRRAAWMRLRSCRCWHPPRPSCARARYSMTNCALHRAMSMQIRCPTSATAAACMPLGMPVKRAVEHTSGNIRAAGDQGVCLDVERRRFRKLVLLRRRCMPSPRGYPSAACSCLCTPLLIAHPVAAEMRRTEILSGSMRA